jgi:glycosyltransferase involved in cell wall biosynthesis
MKILLIGPYPPPHGGISVHVSGIHRQLTAAGVQCEVLDTSNIRSRLRFAMALVPYAAGGWTLHLHTNGHNRNSWLLALLCGTAGQWSGGCVLTLHSGMMPGYVKSGPAWRKELAGFTCRRYSRVICVGPELQDAAISLGTPIARTEVAPACLTTVSPDVALDPQLDAWIQQHRPLLSTALFFRAEYGFDLLVEGLSHLRHWHPGLGCLVMGSGEQHAEAATLVREAGLDDHVRLLGDVDHDTCLTLMSRSDVFVRPTLEDGDSISVREALALGVPVVASRVGSRPPGAILFQPGDFKDMLAQIELAVSDRRREAAPAAGSMDRLLDVYRQVREEI